jgi:mono/diheme cytochrome c family protein
MSNSRPSLAQDGATLYKDQKCFKCHGLSGQGTEGKGPPLKDSKFVMEGTPDEIKATILNGRRGAEKKYPEIKQRMPKFEGKLSDAELDTLVQFLKSDIQKKE